VLVVLQLLRETLSILMEQSPPGLDVDNVGAVLLEDREVFAAHEMHLWTITSGFVAFTADAVGVARRCADALRDHFGIEHATIQPEYAPLHDLRRPRPGPRSR